MQMIVIGLSSMQCNESKLVCVCKIGVCCVVVWTKPLSKISSIHVYLLVVNAIQNVDLFNEFRILISGGIPAGPGARPAHFQHWQQR